MVVKCSFVNISQLSNDVHVVSTAEPDLLDSEGGPAPVIVADDCAQVVDVAAALARNHDDLKRGQNFCCITSKGF